MRDCDRISEKTNAPISSTKSSIATMRFLLIVNSDQRIGVVRFEASTDPSNFPIVALVGGATEKEEFGMNFQPRSKYSRTIAALMSRKEQIQMQINTEMKSRIPCSVTLARLKKVKLWAKDRIASLPNNSRRNGSAIAG